MYRTETSQSFPRHADIQSGSNIDAATTLTLDQALIKAQRCVDMVQHAVSQHTLIVGVAERLGNLLLDPKDVNPEQWVPLDSGVISTIFFLLYCYIMDATSSNLLC